MSNGFVSMETVKYLSNNISLNGHLIMCLYLVGHIAFSYALSRCVEQIIIFLAGHFEFYFGYFKCCYEN